MFMVVGLVCYSMIPLKEVVKAPLLFAFFVMVLPFAFIFQNQSHLDKKIGELSYPIYWTYARYLGCCVFFNENREY